MCGIHFVIKGKVTCQHGLDGFMKNAFLANQVRGTDSSGLFQLQHTKTDGAHDVKYLKRAASGTEFLKEREVGDLLFQADARPVTVGHVRAATAGGVTEANAHPFVVVREDGSRIIGVHNGTLEGWRSKDGASRFDVDSRWLYQKIAEDGVDAFSGFLGAYALVWYDSKTPEVINVARNSKRPLFWALTADRKSMVAASEMGMVGWLAGRNGITLDTDSNGQVEFQYPEEGYLYTINISNPSIVSKEKLPAYDSRRYQKSSTNMYSRNDPNYWDYWDEGYDSYYTRYSQDIVLDDIKKAVSNARDLDKMKEEMSKSMVVSTQKSPPPNLDKTGTDGAVELSSAQWYHSPPVTSTTMPERTEASMCGLYGLKVNACIYIYDHNTGLVYGDFRVRENGKTVSYDCVIRGMDENEADKMVGNGAVNLHPMVVVGVSRSPKTGSRPWVVVEPTYKCGTQNLYNKPSFHVDEKQEYTRESLGVEINVH